MFEIVSLSQFDSEPIAIFQSNDLSVCIGFATGYLAALKNHTSYRVIETEESKFGNFTQLISPLISQDNFRIWVQQVSE